MSTQPAPHPIGVTQLPGGAAGPEAAKALVEETRLFHRQSGRYYVHPITGVEYPSVTTVISHTSGKPWLVNWASKIAAEFTIDNIEAIVRTYNDFGKEGTIDLIKGEAKRLREERADFGSIVHDICETLVKGGPMPEMTEDQEKYVDSFYAWFVEFNVTPLFTETTICRREVAPGKLGYAGTADLGIECDSPWGRRIRVLVDVKTGERIDNSMAEQTAAYLRGDEIWMRDTGQVIRKGDTARCYCPNPEEGKGGDAHTIGSHWPDLEAAFVLHLRPDGYKFMPVQTDGAVYAAFLERLSLWHYNDSRGERVIGLPMRPLIDGKPAPRPCGDVLTPALVKYLAGAGIDTIEQVRDTSDEDLLKIKNVGKAALVKLRAAQSVIGETWIPDGLDVPARNQDAA